MWHRSSPVDTLKPPNPFSDQVSGILGVQYEPREMKKKN